jgi:hypothetical protein
MFAGATGNYGAFTGLFFKDLGALPPGALFAVVTVAAECYFFGLEILA